MVCVKKYSMDEEQKERYVRWENYRITHLTFSINLFLGFAIASLAFVINVKLGSKSHSSIPVEAILFWWSVSAALGGVAILSKLLDYRHTARKIKDGGAFNTFMAKYCGPITWGCFWGQVMSYAIGAYLFIAGVANT